jgi:hypothetical protein
MTTNINNTPQSQFLDQEISPKDNQEPCDLVCNEEILDVNLNPSVDPDIGFISPSKNKFIEGSSNKDIWKVADIKTILKAQEYSPKDDEFYENFLKDYCRYDSFEAMGLDNQSDHDTTC